MGENYNISASPHIRSKVTTSNIMLMVIMALLPATVFGIFNFGLSALVVVAVTTASAVLTEYVYQKLMHKKVTIVWIILTKLLRLYYFLLTNGNYSAKILM